ncbi:ISXO2-like transposase domain [Popillia japonica]|uniref:ISXO2-like transposase domain n=1 Tax=Popillia japonica TaxID=7064 RepID=A0AAW1MEW4_POPJA
MQASMASTSASDSAAPTTPVTMTFMEVMEISRNINELPQHLQRWGLIPTEDYKCPTCGNSLKLERAPESIDGWLWRCYHKISFRKQARRVCGTRVALRTGTFFARSKLSLQQILGFVNLWVRCVPQTFICDELKLSQRTAVDWASFCREVCLEFFMYKPTKLGGPGIVVEIDESKFGRRKYHKGHRIEGQWVFGGFERGTGRVFMVPVEQRDAGTLLPIIKQWIKPGTTIISDCWKAYDVLHQEGWSGLAWLCQVKPGTTIISDCWKAYDVLHQEGYEHLKLNYSITFKDPETGTHPNSIESSWRAAKSSMTTSGRIKAHVPGNLARPGNGQVLLRSLYGLFELKLKQANGLSIPLRSYNVGVYNIVREAFIRIPRATSMYILFTGCNVNVDDG